MKKKSKNAENISNENLLTIKDLSKVSNDLWSSHNDVAIEFSLYFLFNILTITTCKIAKVYDTKASLLFSIYINEINSKFFSGTYPLTFKDIIKNVIKAIKYYNEFIIE